MKTKTEKNSVCCKNKKTKKKSFEDKKKYIEKNAYKLSMPCTDCGGD